MQSDICQVRLDFDNFVIAGPANTIEGGVAAADATGNCLDQMTFALSGGALVPVLCGVMTGQHLYLDMGMVAADTAAISMKLDSTTIVTGISGITVANAYRSWRIKTSQIPCWAPYRAPDGCHQYHLDVVGQIISPNFKSFNSDTGSNALNSAHDLMGQNLKMCIRRAENHCCTLFQVCNSFDGIDLTVTLSGGNVANGAAGEISEGWSFHTWIIGAGKTVVLTLLDNDTGYVDAGCTTDYVEIPDSTTGYKTYGGNQPTNSRYCGHRLGNIPLTTAVTATGRNTHAPIWDCTEPFEVTYRTDQMTDTGVQTFANGVALVDQLRGVCLDYRQDAC